jgi:hypothetical protein
MNYSTLQEAYNIDTFEKKPKPSHKHNKNNGGATQANTPTNTNNTPSYVESSKLASNSNKIQGSCSPLQAPVYNIPISNDCKKDHADAMNVYIDNGANNGNGNNGGGSNPTAQMTSMFNLKNSGGDNRDNVMPFYDEDLEQYFNINNLNDEVKYNSNSYMPNSNKQSYTNNDTGEYTNNNTMLKNGNNLLNNPGYNLTPEEKKSAEEAIAYLKSIEEKITRNSISDPVMPPANTGPGGFKSPIATATTAQSPTTTPTTPTTPETSTQLVVIPAKTDKDKSENYLYNAIFNISILLIIGIAIILLCDLMVELSIQIGMKRAIYILDPFIKAQTTV